MKKHKAVYNLEIRSINVHNCSVTSNKEKFNEEFEDEILKIKNKDMFGIGQDFMEDYSDLINCMLNKGDLEGLLGIYFTNKEKIKISCKKGKIVIEKIGDK